MFASDGEGPGKPVALLARPGQARERLREALHHVGATIVLEDDPGAIDAQTLADAAPGAVLIALEPAIEDALERLDSVLDLPGVIVIFDEAELAARREGWEAQRWARHLAAKLQGHQDVLPPGRETEVSLQPEPGLPETPAQLHADAPIDFHLQEAASHAATVPGDSFYSWQPPAAAIPGFDELQFQRQQAEAEAIAVPSRAPAGAGAASAPPPLPPPPPSAWSLVDDDAALIVAPRAPLAQAEISTEGLTLVALDTDAPADAAVASAVVAKGAVLVMAGIGGPDAIRRLLAALPVGFPQPLLVQLRLDGGRYGNLVKQIARVSALPVLLAEAGQPVSAGNVYILPDDVGVGGGDAGLRFVAQDAGVSVVGGLPAAHSAVLLLSGSDPAQVEAVLALAAQGAWVAGQSGEGCYDPAAGAQLIGRGHPGGDPVQLAQALSERWSG